MRLILLFLLAAALAAPAQAQLPGAAIDVLDYRFALEVSDRSDEIEGHAAILFRALRPISDVEFDLDDAPAADSRSGAGGPAAGMVVISVTLVEPAAATPEPGRALRFSRQDDRLVVALPREASAGEHRRVEVRYRGVPADGFTIGTNRHGERTFFADNWPNRAHHWLPVVDHPSDKAQVAFVVTAPAHYQVVATGAFVAAVDLAGARRRTEWRSRSPVATKVMAVGIARFVRRRQAIVDGVPVEAWVYPQDRELGLRAFAPGPRILGAFERRLGDYPWAKLANVQTTTRWGGLENAGNIFYDENVVDREAGIETLIAHEVAHQWFGDAVTESDWPHVWLSEGLATYLAFCHLEWTYGRERFLEQMEAARGRILTYLEEAPESVVVPESVPDPRRLLSPNVYQKAAWVLHMLRRELGDGPFWQGMRTYYQRFRGRNASTADFAAVMEEVSGRGLGRFFEQWLRQPGVPELDIVWRFDQNASSVELTVRQKGATTYRLPLDIEAVLEDGRIVRRRIAVAAAETSASVPVSGPPAQLRIDPDRWLLMRYSATPQ